MLAAWNGTDQISFFKARDFCNDIIAEDQKQFQHGGTWEIFVHDSDRELVDQIKSKAEERFTNVDAIV